MIYMLTFPNNKKYIGQTTQSLQTRMKQHCGDATTPGRQYNVLKCRAMRKHKYFEVSIIERCNNVDELNRREGEIIDEYLNRGEELYNVASGGLNNCKYLGRSCVVTDLDFNKVNEFDKLKDAMEWIGSSGTVSKPGRYIVTGGKHYVMHVEDYVAYSVDCHRKMLKRQYVERKVERDRRRRKPKKEPLSVKHFNVVQIDHRLNMIRVIDIKEVEKELGMLVRYVLSKDSHHRAYGFYWLTEEQYDLHRKDLTGILSGLDYVYKVDEHGSIIGEWENVVKAAEAEGRNTETISNNLQGVSNLSEPFFYTRSADYEKVKSDMDYIRSRVQGQQNVNTPVQVCELDMYGNLIATYDSKKSCARSIGTTPQRISKAIADGKPYRERIYQNVTGARYIPTPMG